MSKIKILNSCQGYNLYANFYDKKLAYLDSFEQFSLLPNLGIVKNKKILDVGAGTGRLALRLAEKGGIITAIDISEKMLRKLEEKIKKYKPHSGIPTKVGTPAHFNDHEIPIFIGMTEKRRMTTKLADAESLPFSNNSFDIVIAAFLIVHLKEPKYFFSEAYRVLKPKGILAVTNINQKTPPELKTEKGKIIIESYYHRPEKIISELENLFFKITKNIFIKDKDVWINQIIIAEK